jgi:predicted Zn-ribbon and HTH transcriptional regulator
MNPLWALLFAQLGERLVLHGDEIQPESPREPNAAEAIIEARKAMRSLQDFEMHLGENFDRLALICRAMWELMREQNNLTEEDLLIKVREIDLLDGVSDMKLRKPPKKCSKCGRTMSKRHVRCIYCGAEALLDTAFDSI